MWWLWCVPSWRLWSISCYFPVLTYTEIQYAILCWTLGRYLKMLQNSIACFQEHLSFVRFNVSVLFWTASAWNRTDDWVLVHSFQPLGQAGTACRITLMWMAINSFWDTPFPWVRFFNLWHLTSNCWFKRRSSNDLTVSMLTTSAWSSCCSVTPWSISSTFSSIILLSLSIVSSTSISFCTWLIKWVHLQVSCCSELTS
jgi:hypothetical protein